MSAPFRRASEPVDELGRDAEHDHAGGDDAAYTPAGALLYHDGVVSPRTTAEMAARIPTTAITGSPGIRVGRSR